MGSVTAQETKQVTGKKIHSECKKQVQVSERYAILNILTI